MITCPSTLEIAEVVAEFPFQSIQNCVSQGHPFTRPIQVESHQPFKPKNPQTQGTNLYPTIYSKVNYIPPNGKNNGKHPDSHQLKNQLLGYLSSPLTPVFFIPTIIPFWPLTSVFWRWTMMHPKNEPVLWLGFVWCVSGATKNQPPS